jgi:hypothetical protein
MLLSGQTAIISLKNIIRLVSVIEMQGVFFWVVTEILACFLILNELGAGISQSV